MFINAFLSPERILKSQNRHPEVVLHIMIKDYQNDISEVHYAADNIQLVLPIQYTSKELEEELHD